MTQIDPQETKRASTTLLDILAGIAIHADVQTTLRCQYKNRIQNLADQVPALLKAAVGTDLRFTVRIEASGESAPTPEALEKINQLLGEVSDDLRME